MKLTKYLSLNENEQNEFIKNKGILVFEEKNTATKIELYIVDSFYIEITKNIKTNQMLYKKVFKDGELLDKYLAHLDLSFYKKDKK